jgi:hypothetical protein
MSTTTQTSTEVAPSQSKWKDIEKALIDVVKAGIYYKFAKDSKLLKDYKAYVTELRRAEDPDEHVINRATKLFPNEETYTINKERYREWYKNKPRLLKTIEKVNSLYYELAKEYFETEEQINEDAEDFLNSED